VVEHDALAEVGAVLEEFQGQIDVIDTLDVAYPFLERRYVRLAHGDSGLLQLADQYHTSQIEPYRRLERDEKLSDVACTAGKGVFDGFGGREEYLGEGVKHHLLQGRRPRTPFEHAVEGSDAVICLILRGITEKAREEGPGLEGLCIN